jgi:predicted DNA-binding ribbon-helix-helix protein
VQPIDETTLAVLNQRALDADIAEIASRKRGRPQVTDPKVTKGIRLSPHTWEMLATIAEAKGISQAHMLGLLIDREWADQWAADLAEVSGEAPALE